MCPSFDTCSARFESRGEQDRERGFPVADHALADHPQSVRKIERLHRDEFVALMCGLSTLEPGGHEKMDPLIGKTRRREHRCEELDVLRRAAGLFTKLANGAIARIFAGIESACRYLVDESVRRVAILFDQQN